MIWSRLSLARNTLSTSSNLSCPSSMHSPRLIVLTQIRPSPDIDSSSTALLLTSTSGLPSCTGTEYFFASDFGSSLGGGDSMTVTFCSPGLGISKGLEHLGQSICSPEMDSSVVRFWPQCGQSKLRSAMVLERLLNRLILISLPRLCQPKHTIFELHRMGVKGKFSPAR